MKLQWLGYLAIVLICCLPTQTAQAQERTDPCSRPVASPAYATLQLTLKGGQSIYHEGEIIPLELAFASSVVHFLPRGSIGVEEFCLSPESHDPLQDYFESGLWGSSGVPGNIGPYQVLGAGVPYVVNEELNEWKSVPPGSYSLRVKELSVFSVASNEVKFQVLPATPEWQAEQLARALAVLDADHKNPTQSDLEQTKHAVRVLRFLGSEAATRELARRFWFHDQEPHTASAAYPINLFFYGYEHSQKYWDFKAGLIASRYRAAAIQELTAAINDPEHPATRAMAETLALLEIQSKPEYSRLLFLLNDSSGLEAQSKPEYPRILFQPYIDLVATAELGKQQQAKGAAYNDLVAKLLKKAQ